MPSILQSVSAAGRAVIVAMIRMNRNILTTMLLVWMIAVCTSSHAETGSNAEQLSAVGEEQMLFQDIPTVSGASKYEQKLIEAPSAVTILSQTDIKRHGYRTLAEILQSVRGFYVTYDRNYSYVGVRGFGRPEDYNNRILLLVDGHRMNENLYSMMSAGTDAVHDVDLIDRVEIIRGPGSSLYGSNAIFAVINVITLRGRDVSGVEISSEAGNLNTYKGAVRYGERIAGGLDLLLSATSYGSTGQDRLYYREYDSPDTNNGIAERLDYDRSSSYFMKLALGDLTLSGALFGRTKGVPTGSFGTDFNSAGNKSEDRRGYVNIEYSRTFGALANMTVRASYDHYNYYGNYIYSGVQNQDRGIAEWSGVELRLVSQCAEVHRLIAGFEYQYNNLLLQQNYDVAPYQLYGDVNKRSQQWAVYLQDEVSLSKRLAGTLGARIDHYEQFGGTVNPRLAVVYSPTERDAIKLLYGRAFRAPNPFEAYYASSLNTANPDLKPEKMETYEVVYEKFLADNLRFVADAYYYHIRDLIDQEADSSQLTIFRNQQKVSARGVEFSLKHRWNNGAEGRANIAFQKTLDTATNTVLSNSPEALAKLAFNLPVFGDILNAGMEEQYMSTRMDRNRDVLGDVLLTNITLSSRRMQDHLEGSISVYNLFDRKYSDPVSADLRQTAIQQDGRSWRVKLVYSF